MAILFALGIVVGAASQPADTPRAFIERLYAHYRNTDYSPFKHPERVFAPRLLAAIKEDERLAKGEVGYLDGDPVCQCQDAGGMHPKVVGVTQQAPGTATVRVSLGWEGEKPRPAQFSLVRTKAGWRIADVSSADEKSLVGALEQSNREQKKK